MVERRHGGTGLGLIHAVPWRGAQVGAVTGSPPYKASPGPCPGSEQAHARVLDYLGSSGDFGALATRTLVADAAAQIAAQVAAGAEDLFDQNRSPESRLDARHALTYMRDVLDELDGHIHLPPA